MSLDLFTASFDGPGNPRLPSASISLSSLPIRGETKAVPLFSTPIPFDVDLTPFWVGCRLLRLADVGPQQVELARLILAESDGVPLCTEVAVTMPRRATKTTTIWAVLLGLCATRPGFKVVTTAQTYVKARERFLEVARTLAPHNVGDFRILRGAAAEAIEWTNNSRLWVVTPEGGAFRGDAGDVLLFDEAQEHNPETTADLLGGALALMDTRPSARLIVAGTAGKVRAGMLWDFLERGRRGEIGVLEYAVPDGVPVVLELKSPEGRAGADKGWAVNGEHVLNEPAILSAHPGIGTMTTLDVVRSRFQAMKVQQFQREYAGQWPFDATTRAIDPELWRAGQVPTHPPYPARYALGFDVAPDQSSAALVAAWRDADGIAWAEVIEHQAGDSWLPRAIFARTRKAPGLLVGYDRIGPNNAVAVRLEREARPKPKLVDLNTGDTAAAAAQLGADIAAGTFRHVVDPALDGAAEVATRRSIGDGSWAWGRRQGIRDGGDIAPLIAASSALRVFDTLLARPAGRARPRIVSSSSRKAS